MRFAALAIALLMGTTACRRGTERAKEPASEVAPAVSSEAAFWKWFVDHQGEIASIKKGDEPIANELASELHKVDKGLTFEIGSGGGQHELVISADGDKSVFPAVKRLAAAAPAIPGWKVTAFRPRGSADFDIEIKGGAKVSAKDLSFRELRVHDGKVDVVIFVANNPVSDSVKQAVFLLLDSAVGEYDVEMHIGGIRIEPRDAADADVRPFSELPAVVDRAKKTPG